MESKWTDYNEIFKYCENTKIRMNDPNCTIDDIEIYHKTLMSIIKKLTNQSPKLRKEIESYKRFILRILNVKTAQLSRNRSRKLMSMEEKFYAIKTIDWMELERNSLYKERINRLSTKVYNSI